MHHPHLQRYAFFAIQGKKTSELIDKKKAERQHPHPNRATFRLSRTKALLSREVSPTSFSNSSLESSVSLKAVTRRSFASLSPSSAVSNALPFFRVSSLKITYALRHSGQIFINFLQMAMFGLPICMLILASSSSCFLSMPLRSSDSLAAMMICMSIS